MTIAVKKTFDDVDAGIENMLAAAIADYNNGTKNERMKEEFAEGFVVKKGVKYIKIMTNNGGSAWGFVVNTDNDKKFKKGDILKCAGWAAPARNGARGNVLEGGFAINWTGPLYL
jgi:hypothetical protein|tara:strand:- start:622 stop:966 length:345 start_codon:yes stop_codon:yes gene_type:complete